MRGTRGVALVAYVAASVACGDNYSLATDASMQVDDGDAGDGFVTSRCWPGYDFGDDILKDRRGTVTLGAGPETFTPMPERLPLEYGVQAGFMLIAHARMTGFPPGDPGNFLEPSNAYTRIRAFFDDTNVPLNAGAKCAGRPAYVFSDAGDYVLFQRYPVIFDTCWRSGNLFGKRIRVELEVIGSRGGYARDVKIVTAVPPVDPLSYPIEDGTPGCPPPLHHGFLNTQPPNEP